MIFQSTAKQIVFMSREYLATFKKTVAMHEVFLQRLAAHPVLRQDVNFEVFLEFAGDVSQKSIFHCKNNGLVSVHKFISTLR